MTPTAQTRWAGALIALAALTVYWPGLTGPLLFDDGANLEPVRLWLEGEISWLQVVLGNESGPLGRSISMASFVANARLADGSIWGLKFGNLLIHLLTGGLIYLFFRRIAILGKDLSSSAHFVPLIMAALWLLHPMLVSTVLYVVQRMAMLSALFTVAALLAYLHGRLQLETANRRSGIFFLFAIVPTLTVLAALSKENGLLVPLLCAVLETAYFQPPRGRSRPLAVKIFLALGVLVPLALGLVLLLAKPDFFFSGYEIRPFNAMERILTQGRVLWDYVGSFVLPAGPNFSLYRDDYTISTGLLSPWTTVVAWAAWLAVILTALKFKEQLPSFYAGVALFLIGHLMESTLFPLLMYFEHRNYLPAIGLVLAISSLIGAGLRSVTPHMTNPTKVGYAAAGALIILLAIATNARSLVWQSNELLVQQSLQNYPNSRFMRMELANIKMNAANPDPAEARRNYEHLIRLERPTTRLIGHLGMAAVSCFETGTTPTAHLDSAMKIQPESFEPDLESAIGNLVNVVSAIECEGLSAGELGDELSAWLTGTKFPRTLDPIWRTRYQIARLYNQAGLEEKALSEASAAWATGQADLPVGMMIAGLNIRLGRLKEARRMLERIEPELPKGDKVAWNLYNEYRSAVE